MDAFAAADGELVALVATTPRVGGTERRLTWRTGARSGQGTTVTCEPTPAGRGRLVVTVTGLPTPEARDAAREQRSGLLARFLATTA